MSPRAAIAPLMPVSTTSTMAGAKYHCHRLCVGNDDRSAHHAVNARLATSASVLIKCPESDQARPTDAFWATCSSLTNIAPISASVTRNAIERAAHQRAG